MNLSIENMRSIFIVLLVTLFLFILIRELICWCFKINERVAQNNEIIKQLQQINLFNANESINKILHNKDNNNEQIQ